MRDFFDSVGSVPANRRYGRIISIAVLEHMTSLPEEVAEAALRLEPNGVFQAGIPSERGLLWWIGWRFSTGISYYLSTRLDYGVIMRHEHVNNGPEILAVVRRFFHDVRPKYFPCRGNHFSSYRYLEARRPNYDLCRKFFGLAAKEHELA